MKKYDIYLSNQINENINNNIDNVSLIPNYEKQKYIVPNENNFSLNNKNMSNTNHKKERYPYYFQYGNEATNLNDFSSYKNKNYNIEYQKDKLNNNSNSNIVYRNENYNLNWYENFKKSNFYNQWNNNKIDIEQEGMKTPKVVYDIYSKLSGNQLKQLNLSLCNNTKLSLYLPFELSENIDILNASSGYYNDICYPTTSDKGTDIPLKDRQKNFVEENKAVCPDDCFFEDYDEEKKRAQCSCQVKPSPSFFADMKINKTELYKNFLDIKNIANIKILICYQRLFDKLGILKNVGSYVLIFIFLLHFIFICMFCIKYSNILNKKIKEIVLAIKQIKFINAIKEKKGNLNKNIKETDKNKEYSNIKLNFMAENENKIKPRKGNLNKNGKRKRKINKHCNNIKEEDENEEIPQLDLNNKNKNKKMKTKIKIEDENKDNKTPFINNKNNSNNHSNKNKKNRNGRNASKENNNLRQKSKTQKTKNNAEITELKNIMDYKEDELNDLTYNLALQYDKRTYCEYYISLLRTKHSLISSFFGSDDYNSKIIKIDLFFIDFASLYTINALFYSDNTMHKIYEDNGSYDFIYQLPKDIYSSLISMALGLFLNFLALSNSDIIDFKQNKDIYTVLERKNKLWKKLQIKLIFYFIISSLFLILFWYYLSMFGAIYRNTQIHLLKDTLISFLLAFIYPFGINLFPGFFRILALLDQKKGRYCLYRFSQFLQFF